MDGNPRKPYIKTFSCPSCGAPLSIRGLGQTSSMACPSCGSIIDITNEDYEIIHRATRKTRMIALPLGRRGKIKGIEYEVIGYLERCDSSGLYSWEEYLLLNPYRGFAWLVCNQGHWSYVKMTKDQPEWDQSSARLNNTRFKRFLFDTARVKYVLGEFYWRIKLGDSVNTMDFIAPPLMLSAELEQSDLVGEIVWSICEYITPEIVEKSFGELHTTSYPSGVAANQPNPYKESILKILVPWVLGNFFAFFLAIGTPHRQEVILNMSSAAQNSGTLDFGTPKAPIVSKEFTVIGRTSNLAIDVNSPLSNNWIDLDLTLVNSKTKEEEDGNLELSFYYGVEGGESWSEGSSRGRTLFSSVDPGTYTLSIDAQSGENMGTATSIPFELTITQDVPYYGNFLLTLALVNIVPIVIFLLAISMESRRWANSDQTSEE